MEGRNVSDPISCHIGRTQYLFEKVMVPITKNVGKGGLEQSNKPRGRKRVFGIEAFVSRPARYQRASFPDSHWGSVSQRARISASERTGADGKTLCVSLRTGVELGLSPVHPTHPVHLYIPVVISRLSSAVAQALWRMIDFGIVHPP